MVPFHEFDLYFLQSILSIACIVIQCRETERLAFTFTFLLSSADSVRVKYYICSWDQARYNYILFHDSTLTELCGVILAIHFYFTLAICIRLTYLLLLDCQNNSVHNMCTLHFSLFAIFGLNGFPWYGYSFLFHCGVMILVLQNIQHMSVMQELLMAWYC